MSQYPDGSEVHASLLTYARSHGLCAAYTRHDPLAPQNLLLPNVETCHDLPDLAHLPGSREIVPNEKLYLDKDCGLYLHNVFSLAKLDHHLHDHSRFRPKSFKVDSPVLSTDPMLDSRLFTRSLGIPESPTHWEWSDTDKNGSTADLHWLELGMASRLTSQTCSEKLHLTPQDLNFLKQSLKYGTGCGEQTDIVLETHRLRLKQPREYQSPPLLAQMAPFSPDIPGSSVGCMSLATSPRDPDTDILKDIDRCLLGHEVLPETSQVDGEACVSDFDMGNWDASGPAQDTSQLRDSLKRPGGDDFREEVPLLPGAFDSSPFKRTKVVAFSDDLATTIPDCMGHFSPVSNGTMCDGEAEDLIERAFKPLAAHAIREIECEQLTEIDSTARIEIPAIDQTLPPPPWNMGPVCEGHDRGTCTLPLHLVETFVSHDAVWWQARVDQDVATWQPFPADFGSITTKDALEDSSLTSFLDGITRRETGATVWKPEGLRVLDSTEDEEHELPPLSADRADNSNAEAGDLSCILEKRKMLMEGDTRRNVASDQAFNAANRAIEIVPGERERQNVSQIISIGPPSMETSLGRFIQAQTGLGSTVSTTKAVARISPVEAQPKAPSPGRNFQSQPPVYSRMAEPGLKPAPDGQRSQFIMSSSMLSRRTLVNEIQHQYTAAEFIDREFIASDNVNSPSISEADILLSPSTGLMVTALQQIKQKALPGQMIHAGIHESMVRIAGRYERLIVLVSEGNSNAIDRSGDQVYSLDERDCMALASLTTLAARVRAGIQIIYVPGGDIELARWTVSCMARHEISHPIARLVAEETLWEMFLRKAGMNAFAAQALLSAASQTSTARSSDANTSDTGGPKDGFGLSALLQMRPEDRMHRFAQMLEGERLLRRLSRVMDGGWGSGVGRTM